MSEQLPPLPDPMDYCYEWDGPWGTRTFSPSQYNGRGPDRSVAIFNADQMRDYAESAVEINRLKFKHELEKAHELIRDLIDAIARKNPAA